MKRTVFIALTCLAVLVAAGAARAETLSCGVGDATPTWIDFADGSVEFRQALFGRPGVVVATNGVERAAELRSLGAQTVYWHMNMRGLVGTPTIPRPQEEVERRAAALLERARAATGCSTPMIALNELWGAGRATPWPESVMLYRHNVLVLMRVLAEGGATPALLVPGRANGPYVGDTAAEWWKQIASYGHIVKQLYFNAPYIWRKGPIVGSRLRRVAMRTGIERFTSIGIPVNRLGVMLGFQSGPGTGGREGLQPGTAWFEVVKREALAAKQVATELGLPTVWSWGWGTFVHFAPQGADADKAAAACVYLWARDPSLCNGPGAAGPGFDPSLTEGQIALPAGAQCAIGDEVIPEATVAELEALTGDRALALRAALQRHLLEKLAGEVEDADARAAERVAVQGAFGGSQDAYLAELAGRGLTRQAAKNALADVLRAQTAQALLAVTEPGRSFASWLTRGQKAAIREAICLRDEIPRAGPFDWVERVPFLLLPQPSVTIEADRRAVRRGASVTLAGRVSSQRASEEVTVYALAPRASSWEPVGRARVGADGSWSVAVRPSGPGATAYRAISRSAASEPVKIRVRGKGAR